jgi:hypothetical protein
MEVVRVATSLDPVDGQLVSTPQESVARHLAIPAGSDLNDLVHQRIVRKMQFPIPLYTKKFRR